MKLDTEVIDKLFLELSQVTRATTTKEIRMLDMLEQLYVVLEGLAYGSHEAKTVFEIYGKRIRELTGK